MAGKFFPAIYTGARLCTGLTNGEKYEISINPFRFFVLLFSVIFSSA
jgi:hypothetical protein